MSARELTEPARSAEEPRTKPHPSCSSSEPPASQTREPRLILHPNLLLFLQSKYNQAKFPLAGFLARNICNNRAKAL